MKPKRIAKKLSLGKVTVMNLDGTIKAGAEERCARTHVNQSCPPTMQPDTCIETCGFSFEYCTNQFVECPPM